MNVRERFLSVFNFKKPDRIPYWDLYFWAETVERWWKEGLPQGHSPEEHFGLDNWKQIGGIGGSRVPERWRIRAGTKEDDRIYNFTDYSVIDFSPKYEEKVIEETDEYVVFHDVEGMLKKDLKKTTSMVSFLKHPVEGPQDLDAYIKRFDADDGSRYVDGFEVNLLPVVEKDIPIALMVPGFYGHTRWAFGEEKTLFNFAAEPEMIEKCIVSWGDFLIANSERLLESDIPVDFLTVWEDMAYNSGSLISPALFRKYLLPQYKRITKFFKKRGVKFVFVDCDGNVDELIPLFIEGGVDGLYPLEVSAGMDAVKIREEYPDFIIMGNIDKRNIAAGGEAIEQELYAKMPLIEEGGFIPGCDHGVPADVSLENYRYYHNIRVGLGAHILSKQGEE